MNCVAIKVSGGEIVLQISTFLNLLSARVGHQSSVVVMMGEDPHAIETFLAP
jgi:hypothetical protein